MQSVHWCIYNFIRETTARICSEQIIKEIGLWYDLTANHTSSQKTTAKKIFILLRWYLLVHSSAYHNILSAAVSFIQEGNAPNEICLMKVVIVKSIFFHHHHTKRIKELLSDLNLKKLINCRMNVIYEWMQLVSKSVHELKNRHSKLC